MANKRIPIPKALATEVMFAADSTCCVCRENGKAVQIHHIDGNPSNNTLENLVVLCLEHHNRTQMSGGFGRKLDADLVTLHRDEWLKDVKWRRAQANERAVTKVVEGVSISQQHNSLIYFWFDARAFAKRYVVEDGTQLINYFFKHVPTSRILCLVDSLNEVYAVIARKLRKQDETFIQPAYNQAIQKFEREVDNHPDVVKVEATSNQKIAARNLIALHAINSSADALILQCALDKANELRADGNQLVLVSSGRRLLRAAERKSLQTFDPVKDSQEDLDAFINTM